MTQAFRPLLGSDLFADSFEYINDSDEALLTLHAGAVAPSSPMAYQLWGDTLAGFLKQRNAANNAWIVIGVLGQQYLGLLPLSGGSMTGDLDMGGNTIENLGLGTDLAAARVQELNLKAPIAAPQFTGDAQVNQDPTGNNSLVRRSWTEGRYVKLAGSTMTGPLVVVATAAGTHAIGRDEVRNMVTFNTTAGHRHTGNDARRVAGVDLDSGVQTARMFLRSNGTGQCTWGEVLRALYMDPEVVYRHAFGSGDFPVDSGGSWKTVSLSGLVTSGVEVAKLLCRFYENGGSQTMNVAFRKTGSAASWANARRVTTTSFQGSVPSLATKASPAWDTSSQAGPFEMTVQLDASQQFDFSSDRTNGSVFGAAFWLLGER